MTFKELLSTKTFIIADGAQGTELRRLSKEPVESPHLLNFRDPELVKRVIRSYADAGSDFVCANTFSINRYNVRRAGGGESVDAHLKQAITVAKDALRDTNALTALDVSALGKLLEPAGNLSFEEAYEAYREIVTAGEKHGADLIVLETMTDLYEAKAALLAVKENTSLPVICSMTFEQTGRTFTGTPVACMAAVLEGLGADVLGLNCSLGPHELGGLVRELLESTSLPVMVKPNAGLPNPETGEFPLTAYEFAQAMQGFAEAGVKVLGGCCGTTPAFIAELCGKIETVKPNKLSIVKRQSSAVVCGASTAVTIDRPRIIGERINPTGKKAMKEALLAGDMNYILRMAAEQVSSGAHILDINVGTAGIDEVAVLSKVVKAVQGITGIPLQLDSANPAALEAALRVTNGKPIVNSVNADNESLDKILPLVKKYGAAVVGLTLDKRGIPDKAEERFSLAGKIVERAQAYGIKREDVFIDCLVLTAGANQESAKETLRAVKLVKERLGLKTVLGVSNISFGLPGRGVINRTFLTMALQCGLDLPIMNPAERDMTDAVRAYNVLAGTDANAAEYISCANPEAKPPSSSGITLEQAVLSGLKAEAAAIAKKLLESAGPMEIINKMLIPALDTAGELFGQGRLFLPQLIASAEAAEACFAAVKQMFGDAAPSGKRIVLATVKGDIHDIGKNIVRTLLESYGYHVLDLGRDVEPQAILEAARRHDVRLVGLSALMTPTLPAMEETTNLLKAEYPQCRVMVGGAVLTADYAAKIGADYYGPDAKAAVNIAAKVFGENP